LKIDIITKDFSLNFFLNNLFYFCLQFFLFVLVFDPQDTIFNLKTQLFVIIFLVNIFLIYNNTSEFRLSFKILLFPLIFLVAPVVSIIENKLIRSQGVFYDLGLLKPFIFFWFILPIHSSRCNFIKSLLLPLNILSFTILFIFVLSFFYLDTFFFNSLVDFGNKSKNLFIGQRLFSDSLKLFQVFYVSSTLLFIPLAYYSGSFFSGRSKNLPTFSMFFFTLMALFCAGTKANILGAFLILFSIFLSYYKYKKSNLTIYFFLFLLIIFLFHFRGFFSIANNPNYDNANYIRLNLLFEYSEIFNNINTLLWGDGLGSYRYWMTRNSFNFISEWTYLELFRWFGIFLCLPVFFVLLFPLYYFNKSTKLRDLLIAYIFYLIVSIFNPLLFSSLGILFLCLIYIEIFNLNDKSSSPNRSVLYS